MLSGGATGLYPGACNLHQKINLPKGHAAQLVIADAELIPHREEGFDRLSI